MNEVVSYIELLIDGSKKKKDLLMRLYEITKEQAAIAKQEDFQLKDFNATISQKETCLKNIKVLDNGFNSIYERIRQDLLRDKLTYEEKLKELKALIGEIADIGFQIQVEEERNKQLIERQLSRHKKEIKQFKTSRKTVTSYYKNMKNTHKDQSYFLDKKK